MYISKFFIRNFRNFESAELNFSEGVNTIIGENGSGKTNLFYALRLMLDDTLPRYLKLTENDFSRQLSDWRGHWIILTLNFEALGFDDATQALSIHACGDVSSSNEINQTQGSYTLCFRPKRHIRQELYDYSKETNKNKDELQVLLDKITIDEYETVYLCKGSAQCSEDDFYDQYVGNFEGIIFPDPSQAETQVYGVYLPRELNLYDEISCTFIKALRDVNSDLRSYSKNPLVSLLRGKEKTVEISIQSDLVNSINEINESISTLEEVSNVQKGIDSSLKQAVGTTYAPNIEVRAELPNEMDKLLQSLRLWVGDSDDEHVGRLSELSLGGANLIFLSLKLYEYEKIKTDKVANLLLIEEPEAHIHTHIQKTLFDNLSRHEHKPQIFISTHSTQISSVSKISSVNILSRREKSSVVFNPTNGLEVDKIRRIERYLDAVRSDLLFAKGVVLVEGDAEQILLPVIFQKVFGLSLDEIGVSIINVGSTSFENIANIYHQDRVNRRCAILTDLDEAFIQLPSPDSQHSPAQIKARNSQKSGQERKVKLEEFCSDNECIKPFYAKHTFEVDLINEKNSNLFVPVLSEMYKPTSLSDIASSKSQLKSSNIEMQGTEVLRLAKKAGKGWFAIAVADQVTEYVNIPDYILKAIAWASPHLNLSSKVKAAEYRLNTRYELTHKDYMDGGELEYSEEWDWCEELKDDEEFFVSNYQNELPEDPLTKLLSLYDF
ncbi:ATP-dependent nuclease [Psychrobacter sp. PAMC 21119]|uniref:ATP-dependent nuclease n=1 Tax=Psychrobacter sp. PAMC 21119 TaxID=1112209 RepID=UPI00028815C9|nr:AAA family ATPase [Psychrobacter sp. PAMC 21119]